MKSTILKHALWNIALYSLDMGVAIVGFVYGFGLPVKNWWALIGIMLFARWAINTLIVARRLHSEKDDSTNNKAMNRKSRGRRDWIGCHDCFGSGGPKQHPCRTCNGTGKINKEDL